ncbi:MAG: hypothetical protein RL033_742, partial [Pseudomonadota bacterium]
MLEKYCPSFAGFYLYFPERRYVAPKLRALVEHVRFRAGKSTRRPPTPRTRES